MWRLTMGGLLLARVRKEVWKFYLIKFSFNRGHH
uniref:Uncharacterized protein n=1 Tax=Anguilla anguilla TaxID=7936 RepID=A0A0E9TEI9_ANGAN